MELNAKIVLNPDGSYDILLQEDGKSVKRDADELKILAINFAREENKARNKEEGLQNVSIRGEPYLWNDKTHDLFHRDKTTWVKKEKAGKFIRPKSKDDPSPILTESEYRLATMPSEKKELLKRRIREAVESRRKAKEEKAKKEAEEKAFKESTAAIKKYLPTSKKNAITVNGEELIEILEGEEKLSPKSLAAARNKYTKDKLYKVYKTTRKVMIEEVKTEFASEMDRLDAHLSASLRESIESDPELLAKIMGTFGPLVKKKK